MRLCRMDSLFGNTLTALDLIPNAARQIQQHKQKNFDVH